ncbi:hypothetical protein F5B22DRAFT_651703 [Xylaria bambusicola]|uniref:uncharacterized protein n=1 Tax=Xylaria bambusicola TaxID=326684 RepID=UPI0020087124|nr:uncharacterized protein F5B22DRAFT_651703 [Xylaria bambusicola]KAI0505446.1 hypothetical protein F5B22DRAFT_651703 [Xylaria bambusicola]
MFFSKRQISAYNKVPNTDVHDDEEQLPNIKTRWNEKSLLQPRTVIILTVIITIVLTISVSAIASILGLKSVDEPLEEESISCGHTPTEARAAGCVFEPMMSAWIPAQCSFPELIDDTAGTFENWLFFSDQTLKRPITGVELEGVRVGNYTKVFSSHGTGHDLHCLYAWRKLNLAVESGAKLIDTKSRSLHHTTHCAKHIAQLLEEGAGFLPKDEDMRRITAFPLLFLKCIPLI